MDQLIQTLIVDDELYSRDELKHLLSSFPSIQLVDEAASGEDAVKKALQHQLDVVFLDVEMPKMDGMKAAEAIRKLRHAPLIVFATAYPQFAAEAFRHDAVDYLLKPYDEEQLQETIQRIENKLFTSQQTDKTKPTGKLAVDADGEIFYLEPKEILYMSRMDKLTKLITKTGEYETKIPLKELESRLLAYGFFRIHKSFLVNLEYVSRLTPWFNGAYHLHVDGHDEVLSVSRNYAKALRQRLEI
ncbi:MAG: LytR/AlgR family response regulator transcription factor [Bacillota bacterium]|uniref:LytR/AlgR family response regulator transcription factor n=1 Tax=Virgibacillus sp. AGTR TaxID=2812055 RepID=UPI001963DE43|nr:LytTR family DNA-binding domain-containing protein [Virgibacillus sp. AGTR]MCC2252235.1 LytTR family DNA-binding domain-containing protein [Virgibacillus sp. AGTR]QRZ18893.1 response regulator transcription factor [Virgibacillus sp. AGTR]